MYSCDIFDEENFKEIEKDFIKLQKKLQVALIENKSWERKYYKAQIEALAEVFENDSIYKQISKDKELSKDEDYLFDTFIYSGRLANINELRDPVSIDDEPEDIPNDTYYDAICGYLKFYSNCFSKKVLAIMNEIKELVDTADEKLWRKEMEEREKEGAKTTKEQALQKIDTEKLKEIFLDTKKYDIEQEFLNQPHVLNDTKIWTQEALDIAVNDQLYFKLTYARQDDGIRGYSDMSIDEITKNKDEIIEEIYEDICSFLVDEASIEYADTLKTKNAKKRNR